MPTFYTKTISSILEPVAQQVSLLVILHEEAESGVIIPDLGHPINVVKAAVLNLTQIGSQTYQLSKDDILKRDMPPALKRVEEASEDLQAAATLLDADKSSLAARKKLIDGSRGILQGTSTVLVVYDMSEVRKIIATCNNVKSQLTLVEHIQSMEHLALFIKNLTPQLTGMTKLTVNRANELIVKTHSDILLQSVYQIKNSIPILLSSLKTLIINNDNPGGCVSEQSADQCRTNRNYSVLKLLDHIQEIIRVLQMTGETESAWWENEQYFNIREANTKIEGRSKLVDEWINNSINKMGETCLFEAATADVLTNLAIVVDNCSDPQLRKELASRLSSLRESHKAAKQSTLQGEVGSVDSQRHRQQFRQKLTEAIRLTGEALAAAKCQSSNQMIARTLDGRVAQAQMWLACPDGPERVLGVQACRALAEDAALFGLRRQNVNSTDHVDSSLSGLSSSIRARTDRLDQLSKAGKARSTEGGQLSQELQHDIGSLRHVIASTIIDRVADTFVDTKGPLRRLAEAAVAAPSQRDRCEQYDDAAQLFANQGEEICATASLIPYTISDAQQISSLKTLTEEIKLLTPQVVSAGKVVLMNGGDQCPQPIKDHFNNMRNEWEKNVETLTTEVDKLTDTAAYVIAQEVAIDEESERMERSIQSGSAPGIVEGTSNIARRASRIAQKADTELSQVEDDPRYIDNLERSVTQLRASITPMAVSAKNLMTNHSDPAVINDWRQHNTDLRNAVKGVRLAVTPSNASSIAESLQSVSLSTTDSKSDNEADDHFNFPAAQPNQPILAAAHVLHSEAKQWSSKDNEIIAAAKRMATLMARLSHLVRGENSSKKELIDVAKEIAQASEEVTRCARKLGEACTDIRIKNNLLQICDRIPTIGTQLRILSTVKATMLGSQEETEELSEALTFVTQDESELNCGSDEDQEATEMLVGNAQNLMQNVIETVHAAEAASIKMRVDSGCKIRWTKRTPWYHNQARL